MIAAIIKKFVHGILYIFILPLLLIVLSVYAIIGVFMFVFVGLKAILLFFTGRNLFGDLPEDIKAKQILTGKKQEYVLETNTTNIPIQGEELEIGDREVNISTTPASTTPPESITPASTLPETNPFVSNQTEPSNEYGANEEDKL